MLPEPDARRGMEMHHVEVELSTGRNLARAVAVARHLHQRYAASIGAHRAFDPRRQSVVQRRVDVPAPRLACALSRIRRIRFSGGSLRPAPAAQLTYDPVNHEHVLPAKMHVSWAWPDLPVWLAVGDFSSTTSVLRLSLRSRSRVRYPARYFNSAHAALLALVPDAHIAVG
jgi:hypothetical protein